MKKINYYLNFNINLPTQILELKSDLSVSNYAKSLNAIFDKFNLIRSRFSKYCTGIKIIY